MLEIGWVGGGSVLTVSSTRQDGLLRGGRAAVENPPDGPVLAAYGRNLGLRWSKPEYLRGNPEIKTLDAFDFAATDGAVTRGCAHVVLRFVRSHRRLSTARRIHLFYANSVPRDFHADRTTLATTAISSIGSIGLATCV
jgi:hypothetical protein